MNKLKNKLKQNTFHKLNKINNFHELKNKLNKLKNNFHN